MNRTSLIAAVLTWVNRPEIEPQIPAFIELTEADLSRRLSEAGLSGAEGRSVSNIEAEYGAAPADLARAIRLVRTADGVECEAMTEAAFAAVKAADPDRTGAPEAYVLAGSALRYFPVPDGEYEVELTYLKRLPALSAQAPSNWLIAAHPDVYLYGTLLRAAEYLGGDARLGTWQGLYEAAVASAFAAERNRRGERRSAYRADVPLGRG